MNLEYCYCASHTGELLPAYAETLGLNTCRVLGRHFRPAVLGAGGGAGGAAFDHAARHFPLSQLRGVGVPTSSG